MTHHVRGSSPRPLPPGASQHQDVRHADLHEGDALDEALLGAG